MPEHTGAVLGADLHRLLIIARDRLPEVADCYLEANRHVAATADTDTTAFGDSRVAKVWMDLRDEYQGILGRAADNLMDTAAALERVVEYYASTDEAAAAELKRLIPDSAADNPPVGSRDRAGVPPADAPRG